MRELTSRLFKLWCKKISFQQLQDRVFFLTGTDSNSWTANTFSLAIGRALERVVTLINRSDARWQFDDSNYSDLPSATLQINSGQQQYSLATSHLTIDRMEAQDSAGNWYLLKPINQQLLKRDRSQPIAIGVSNPVTGRTGAYQNVSGIPTEYMVNGIALFLFPIPNYTLAAGLRIYFARAPLLFTYATLGSSATGTFTDGTGSISSSPGFNSLFHDLVALWAAYDYGLAFSKQNMNNIFVEIQRKEQELMDFYMSRNRDERPRLAPTMDSNM